MNGQAGGRGYLIQAVIAVLDALDDDEWIECVLEPNLGEDKIDLLLRSENGERVSQIKSSQNPIGAAHVSAWAKSLEDAYPGAKRYELRLIGPVTSGVLPLQPVGKVEIPVPESLNIRGLLERCAHRLDQSVRDLGHGATRPGARELLAEALATRLGTLAASSEALTRKALKELIASWVAELLPSSTQDEIPTPHQLPCAPADFIGRHEEITFMRNAVEQGNVGVVIIRGMTGVGKSALAARIAADLEQRYSDGQVYVDVRGVNSGSRPTAHLLTDVIQAFYPAYPSSDDVARCSADFRTLLNDRRVLLLVENVESAEKIEKLIPPTTRSLLIITTQSRFDVPGAVKIDLQVLPEQDGKTLFKTIAPRVSDSAAELAQICGCLPLAIRIAGGTLNARPDISPEAYIGRLGGVKERAKLVAAALDVSFAYVADETKDFLVATAAFEGNFDAAGIAAVWNQSEDSTDAQIATTIGRHLIEWDVKRQRYGLHDLVRAYIIETAEAKECGVFLTRHAYYYADLCSEVDQLYREGGESVFSALSLFDAERTNIASGFSFSANHVSAEESAAEICTTFIRGLTHVMDLRISALARADMLITGLKAAETLRDSGLLVLHTGNLGRVYRELGELDESIKCQEWVLRLAIDYGHREDQALAHHHIGLALLDKMEILAGIDHLEKSLTLSRDKTLKLRSLEGTTLNNLGNAYLKMDRPAKALEYLRPALEIQREVNDPHILAYTLTNLGNALATTKSDPGLAIEMLESAIGIAEDLDDARTQLAARPPLSQVLALVGRSDEALAIAQLQQAEAARLGHLELEADATRIIGDLHLAAGETESARNAYEALMQLARDRKDSVTECKALSAFAGIAMHDGDKAKAIVLLEKRLALATSPQDKAKVSFKLGELCAEEGDRKRAITLLRVALEYYLSVDHEVVDALRDRIRKVEEDDVATR